MRLNERSWCSILLLETHSMTLKIQVIPLTSQDKDQVNHLFAISIADTFVKEGLTELTQTCEDEIKYKIQLIEDALSEQRFGFSFMVAKQDDKVVGIISYGPCGEDIKACSADSVSHLGELGSLYVLPVMQNQGVGSTLIQAMVETLLIQGIQHFCLDSGYPSAQKRWIQKFGKPQYRVKDYWGKGMDHCVWVCTTQEVLKSKSN